MIVIFTFALLVLLAIGVPVAFSLGASGLLGMVLFMPSDGALEQIPSWPIRLSMILSSAPCRFTSS